MLLIINFKNLTIQTFQNVKLIRFQDKPKMTNNPNFTKVKLEANNYQLIQTKKTTKIFYKNIPQLIVWKEKVWNVWKN